MNHLLKGKSKRVHIENWREKGVEVSDVIGYKNKNTLYFHSYYDKNRFLEGICINYNDNNPENTYYDLRSDYLRYYFQSNVYGIKLKIQ